MVQEIALSSCTIDFPGDTKPIMLSGWIVHLYVTGVSAEIGQTVFRVACGSCCHRIICGYGSELDTDIRLIFILTGIPAAVF